jgi:hypothetical protein
MISQITPAGYSPASRAYGTFRLTGSLQHPARLGFDGENMPGSGEIGRLGLGIDGDLNRFGAVCCRNACRHIFFGIDRYGEGRPERSGVVDGLLGEMELVHPFRRQGEADQAASMLSHEIDGLRGHMLRCDDEIPLIFTIFVVDQNDELPSLDIANGCLDRVKRSRHRMAFLIP